MTRGERCLRGLWPKRLITQTILLLLLALLAANIVGALIIRGETQSLFRGVESRIVAERIGPVVTLLRTSPPHLHEQVARTIASRRMQVWLSRESAVPADSKLGHEDRKRARDIAERIAAEIGDPDTRRVRVFVREDDDGDDERTFPHAAMMHGMIRGMPPGMPPGMPSGMPPGTTPGTPPGVPMGAPRIDAVVSVGIDADHWLNAGIRLRPARRLISSDTWVVMGITAVVLSVIVALALGGITRPLRRLSDAAARLGRGEKIDPVPEQGPMDVRETIRAFNDMHARLDRFVTDRTRMLAAISHDLRTPITSLRLRAEMLDDNEARERMIATLDEMKAITEATLAFAREDAKKEDNRAADLNALVSSIADDLGELGRSVEFSPAGRIVLDCRPTALGRALRNLIENAAVYGGKASIRVDEGERDVRIVIDDDGPGIPEADRERVFEPFVRLEGSRNRETGGIGLGMAIARDIVRGHGGDVTLADRPEGGLRVTVTLPGNSPSGTFT